jgi:DNA-binding PadR family transcriptional regulator
LAGRRRVSNLLALAVLATLAERPMHRYEMAALMRARGKDRDMNIKWGSLYTVVSNMEKHGLLEPIGVTRHGARPERTVYQITDEGRRELVEWTRELVADPQTEHTSFTAGLSVLSALSPEDAADLLRQRLTRLAEQITAQQEERARYAGDIPRLFLIEDEYRTAMLRAEADFVRSLVDELSDGTFPDLDIWRAWHETRSLPPEFEELSRRGAPPDS